MKLNKSLRTFWRTRKPIKVLYGGRMSSKSYDTAGVLLYLASTCKLRILCIRRYQNKISESVYALLKEIIEDEEYFKEKFTILKNGIKCDTTGSEFVFFGIHNSIEEVVGLQGINITWLEEAHTIKKEEWDKIRPTILRKGSGAFCVLVFNPQLETDFVYKNFVLKKRDDTLVRKINYTENPFLSDGGKDLIASDKENLDEDDFNHIYLGYPKKNNADSIIKRSWVDACIDAHIKLNIEPTGIQKIGFDIADDGSDSNALIRTHGILTVESKEWHANEDELMLSSLKAYEMATKHNAIIQYDCIGVGASAGSHFKQYNKERNARVKFTKFDAGGAVQNQDKEYQAQVKNKDFFLNLKAQSWWNVADRMKDTYNAVVNSKPFDPENIISISSDLKGLDTLIEQLCIPKKDYNANYKNKVESKDDLKKRGISSPNQADAFIMAYANLKKSGLSSSQF